MKKGQIEIMGLVVIVILLVFIAVFSLSFMIKPKQESDDILKLKANALRSSLLKTNLCENVDVQDELRNCVQGFSSCFDNCNYLKDEIVKIIEISLEKEKYSFNFGSIMIGECVEKVTAVSQNIGDESLEISLCRR